MSMSPKGVVTILESLMESRCDDNEVVEALEIAIKAVYSQFKLIDGPPRPDVVFVPKRRSSPTPPHQGGLEKAALRFHRREEADDGVPY